MITFRTPGILDENRAITGAKRPATAPLKEEIMSNEQNKDQTGKPANEQDKAQPSTNPQRQQDQANPADQKPGQPNQGDAAKKQQS